MSQYWENVPIIRKCPNNEKIDAVCIRLMNKWVSNRCPSRSSSSPILGIPSTSSVGRSSISWCQTPFPRYSNNSGDSNKISPTLRVPICAQFYGSNCEQRSRPWWTWGPSPKCSVPNPLPCSFLWCPIWIRWNSSGRSSPRLGWDPWWGRGQLDPIVDGVVVRDPSGERIFENCIGQWEREFSFRSWNVQPVITVSFGKSYPSDWTGWRCDFRPVIAPFKELVELEHHALFSPSWFQSQCLAKRKSR